MDENKYNDLDKLFRSRLRSEGTASGDWNTPSDDIFDRAMSELNNKKRRPFPLLWFIPLFLIVVLSGIILWQQKQMSELRSEMTRMEVINNSRSEGQDRNTTNASFAGRTENDNAQQKSNKTSQVSNEFKKDQSSTILSPEQSGISPVNVSAADGNKVTPEKKADQQSIASTEAPIKTSPNIGTVHIASAENRNQKILHAIPGLRMRQLNTEPLQNISYPMLIKDSHDKGGKLSAIFFLSPELTTLHMTDLPVVDYSLTEYDQYYFGYSLGLGGRYQFNDEWSLDMTGAYHHTDNKSEFVEDMPYDKQNESQSPGQPTTYRTTVGVASPIGGSEKNISMNVENVNIPDNEMITNRTYIDHSFQHVSLSLAPRYHFLNTARIFASVSAGARINYLFNTKEKMEMGIYYGGQNLKTETFEHRDPPTINRWFGGLYANLEIGYKISEQYSVGLQSGYYRSLTSIKEYNRSDAAKTYLNSFNLNLNFQLRF